MKTSELIATVTTFMESEYGGGIILISLMEDRPGIRREIDMDDFLLTEGIDGDYGFWDNLPFEEQLRMIQAYVNEYVAVFEKLPSQI